MPVEVSCTACGGRFRVPDTAAGKRIKCPKCKAPIEVPGAADTGTWTLKTEDGAEYGPATRSELDAWHVEGRITADCQLLQTGAAQWQWATDLYPDLTPSETPAAGSGGFLIDTGEAHPGTSAIRGRSSSIGSRSSVGSKGKSVNGKRGHKGPKNVIDTLSLVTYILAGLQVAGGLMLVVAPSAIIGTVLGTADVPDDARAAANVAGGAMMAVFVAAGGFAMLFSCLYFLGGYGLSQRKSWGKTLMLVLGALGILTFNPLQIAYGIWVFVVLLDKKYAEEFR